MNVFEFARKHLYPYKVKGAEIVPTYCPYCHGGERHDKDTFALSTVNQTYNCKRGSCGKQGHFSQLAKEWGEEVDRDRDGYELYKSPKQYKKPTTKLCNMTNQAEEYLKLRGISKGTMDMLRVECDEKGNIVFPYFENGQLVFVKFRPAKKIEKGERKAWREEGGKPILWGMDLCKNDIPLIITEGEIDTLACYEAGLTNIVSVPSGAEDMTWLDTCWEFLQGFKKIVLFGDMDEPGKEMVRKLILKLGAYRCYTVENRYKDANELLYRDGKEAVRNIVESAKPVPIVGLLDLADVKALDVTNIQKVSTGIPALDREVGGTTFGTVTVLTGKRGEGKSTIAGIFLLEAVNAGHPVCAYSGELAAEHFQYWINLQAAGQMHVDKYFDPMRGIEVPFIRKEKQEKIQDWYRGKFFLYDNKIAYNSQSEETSILKVFEYAAQRYDCKVFMIDNLMSARKEYETANDFYRAQGNFVGRLTDFAKAFNVAVYLVAHPRKTKGNVGNDDVSGTSEIPDRADNCYVITRNHEEGEQGGKLMINKNRGDGNIDIEISLGYCNISRRLYQKSIGDTKIYGWHNTGKNQDAEDAEEVTEWEQCPF